MTDVAVTISRRSVTAALSQGLAGHGVEAGGTTGQVLQKDSSTDYDTSWVTAYWLPLAGGVLTGPLFVNGWTELSGEDPDGWPLVPFPDSTHRPPLVFQEDDSGNHFGMYEHRGHLMVAVLDVANASGNGANYWIPVITLGSQATNGITFPSGWRFNNDPTAQGATFNPYDSGIRNGYGTGVHLTANYTASAYANGTKVFEWMPAGFKHNRGVRYATSSSYKTDNYTATTADDLILCGAGNYTIFLPTAVGIAGQEYRFKKFGSGLTYVEANGVEVIDGYDNWQLNDEHALTIMSDGTRWVVMASYAP